MTTTLIPSTSSAPTLRERAIAEAEMAEETSRAEWLRRRREKLNRQIDVLGIQLRDHLGVVDGVSIAEFYFNDGIVEGVEIRASVDGLTFRLNEDAVYVEKVQVLVPCERSCGKDLWVGVDDLRSLGRALSEPRSHNFACLQQFDDEGEPTTDTQGNPLPPTPSSDYEIVDAGTPIDRERTVPVLTARRSIGSIENAGARVAHAMNTIAELEDARALIKPQAIKRLMESSAASSATAAERIVEADPDYAAHRVKQRDAECEKWGALAAYEQSKLAATLDVALVTTAAREIP